MSFNKDACSIVEYLSKSTLVSFLPSKIDTSKAIVKATGEIIDLSNVPSNIIKQNINNNSWIYYETLLPRRMLLTNPNWVINSFDSKSKIACVTMYSKSGSSHFSFLINPPALKF
jgi:hypothetical protein